MEAHLSNLPPDIVGCAFTRTYAQSPGAVCGFTQQYGLDIPGCDIYDA
jgi:hypothetical protein